MLKTKEHSPAGRDDSGHAENAGAAVGWAERSEPSVEMPNTLLGLAALSPAYGRLESGSAQRLPQLTCKVWPWCTAYAGALM